MLAGTERDDVLHVNKNQFVNQLPRPFFCKACACVSLILLPIYFLYNLFSGEKRFLYPFFQKACLYPLK